MNTSELKSNVEDISIKMFSKCFNRATTYYFYEYINLAFNDYAGSIGDVHSIEALKNSCYRIAKNILVPEEYKLAKFKIKLELLFLEYKTINNIVPVQ